MKYLLVIIFSVFILSSCDIRLSNEDLAEEVTASIEEWAADQGVDMTIDSLIITRESDNSNLYKGILETTECKFGGCNEFIYAVKITYDGEYFAWEIQP